MDALMAALVLGALCQLGDRTPWLATILADRYASVTVLAAALLALALNYVIGAAIGIALAPLLAPNAKALLLALALLLAAVGTPWRSRAPDRLAGWRLGGFLTSFLGLAIMALGDRMQFVATALAARSPLPWAAAVGATLGAMAVVTPAVLLGERRWTALPQRAIGIGSSVVLAIAGIVIGLGGLGLI